MSSEFRSFQKIPRWSRDIAITEKIDGTNTSVWVDHFTREQIEDRESDIPNQIDALVVLVDQGKAVYSEHPEGDHITFVRAGSANGFIWPKKDHYGFAEWVWGYADLLGGLGNGSHFGEWYGHKIQRGYGMNERRWALFNVGRWSQRLGDEAPPACCDVVPVLYSGPMHLEHGEAATDFWLRKLEFSGSAATGAEGFKDPEGIVIYHTASGDLYKQTIGHDGHKSQLA
jgi:hypothetical protein